MESRLEREKLHNIEHVNSMHYEAVGRLCESLRKKYPSMIASLLIKRPESGADASEIIVVVDDFNSTVLDQTVDDIKVSASELAYSSRLRLRCDAILASSLWEGFNSREEAIMQLVRGTLVVYDNGFFIPLQELLVTGKVRPSKESVKVYFVKSERSIKSSSEHVSKAVLDLYWAVTDSAHAAVMVAGITPPSPKELAETLKRELVARNLVHKRCGDIVDRFYDVAKKVMHKEIFEISGREFDSYFSDADFFIKEMDDFVKTQFKR
ncbi:hypothetical protein HZB90_01825 [archaeon]|nr:hypothetical protein [archaeon]